MNVWFVIFEHIQYSPNPHLAIKHIHKVVPTTVDKIENTLQDNAELFRIAFRAQWELVVRSDDTYLEEMVVE